MSAINGLLFDFDGTLADSFDAITASTNFVRAKHGLPAMAEPAVRSHVGFGLAQLMEKLIPHVSPTQTVAEYRTHHQTVALPLTRLLPGVAETIATLHALGVPMGVCSNKAVHFTKALVAHLFPATPFATVLGPEDVPAPKPDPAMLLEGCQRLKVSAKNMAYVGDMPVDVQAAKAAQIPAWIVTGGAASLDVIVASQPDRILNKFEELLSLVTLQYGATYEPPAH